MSVDARDVGHALAAIIKDIQTTTSLEFSAWSTPCDELNISYDYKSNLSYDYSGDSSGFSMPYIWVSETYDSLASDIADVIQTDIEFKLRELWPPCPKHRAHSLSTASRSGYWECPDNKQIRFRIGELEI